MTNQTRRAPEQIIAAVAATRQLDSYQVTALATQIGMKHTGGDNTDPEIVEAITTLRQVATLLKAKGL